VAEGLCRDRTPGQVPHGLQRWAVRRMLQAGVVESRVMRLVGMKTPDIFDPYNIVVEDDLRETLAKVRIRQTRTRARTMGE
jgi:hypothetical protein